MGKEDIKLSGYSIIRRLGTGARTVIYLAKEDATRNTVALKRAVAERPEDARIFEQMEQEYEIARQIDSPYVRKCHRLLRIRSMLRTKELYLVMEWFDGMALEDSPSLSIVDVLLVFRMVANGLHAMHQRGFVHCDIKPNNILFNPSGTVKIIDLGQSCRTGARKQRIQGTPDYIAPEQVRREPLDQRTDIFNLGATMYWAFTGKNVPTLIPKNDTLGMAMPASQFQSPHEIHRRIPIGISKLIMDCVRERQADRPATMGDVMSRLDLLIHSILGPKMQNPKGGAVSNLQ
ncbi:MAG TPA: serine/threonine-protein kinase [Sedimentisphaerales bacterium]|nr:serine/threonine-protein kinase [Sedimentisphaerales bacterium]